MDGSLRGVTTGSEGQHLGGARRAGGSCSPHGPRPQAAAQRPRPLGSRVLGLQVTPLAFPHRPALISRKSRPHQDKDSKAGRIGGNVTPQGPVTNPKSDTVRE